MSLKANAKLTGSERSERSGAALLLGAFIERFSEMKKEIEMAEHQLTGFASARNGESIEQLACSMGLTVDEWNTIKVHGIVVLPKDDEAALDEYFR